MTLSAADRPRLDRAVTQDDSAYRVRHRMPGAEVPSSAGFAGRTVVVAELAAAGAGASTAGVLILSAFLLVLAVRRTGRLWGRCGTAYADATGRGGDG